MLRLGDTLSSTQRWSGASGRWRVGQVEVDVIFYMSIVRPGQHSQSHFLSFLSLPPACPGVITQRRDLCITDKRRSEPRCDPLKDTSLRRLCCDLECIASS
jgi:hypothetical protein